MCQRMKNRTEILAGKLIINKVLEKLWKYLIVDFIYKIAISSWKDVILVVYNILSKIAHFMATIEETLAEGLAQLFRNNIWKLYGLPESVILDRGLLFTAELTKELNRILEIETKLSTSFHPQMNGQTK